MDSIDFSKHPIYFFDDLQSNYDPDSFTKLVQGGGPPVMFVEIPPVAADRQRVRLEQNKVVAKKFEITHQVKVPFRLTQEFTTNQKAGELFMGAGFRKKHAAAAEARFDLGARGVPLALIFDWDKTMTLRNGGYTALEGESLHEQATRVGWNTTTLAKWYLHDPADTSDTYQTGDDRISELTGFFDAVRAAEIPVFILTKNPLAKSNPRIMLEILEVGLNLKIHEFGGSLIYAEDKSLEILGTICNALSGNGRIDKIVDLWVRSETAGGAEAVAPASATRRPPSASRRSPDTGGKAAVDPGAAAEMSQPPRRGGRKTRRKAYRKKRRKTPRQRRHKGRKTRQKRRRKRRKKTRN